MRRERPFFIPNLSPPVLPHSSTKTSFPTCKASPPSNSSPPPPPRAKRPYGYWTSHDNIRKELNDYLKTAQNPSVMPTERELAAAGRNDLAGAIRRHSTWKDIANQMDLVLSSVARPRSLNLIFCTNLQLRSGGMRPYMYWRAFENLEHELLTFMQTPHTDDNPAETSPPSVIPTAAEMEKAGRSDLIRAIGIHGGWEAVASRMNIQVRYHSSAVWEDFSNVESEIRRIISSDGNLSSNTMPSLAVLKREGARGLYTAVIRRHGGAAQVARRMGLTILVSRKPRGYWASLENRKMEVENCVRLLCKKYPERDEKMMPTRAELSVIRRSDVARGLIRYGGFEDVASALGLTLGDGV